MNSIKPTSSAAARSKAAAHTPGRSYHFLFAPVLLSIVALLLLLSPAMAEPKDQSFAACPYLKQVHQAYPLKLPHGEVKPMLTTTVYPHQEFEERQPDVKTYHF